MNVVESFIDCIYEPHLYKEDMEKIRMKLINKLPDKRIADLSSVLMIETKYDIYAVKIRLACTDEKGNIDIKKTHDKIRESEFYEVSRSDYSELSQYQEIMKRTNEIIKPGDCIIFKMDIDVDTLLETE